MQNNSSIGRQSLFLAGLFLIIPTLLGSELSTIPCPEVGFAPQMSSKVDASLQALISKEQRAGFVVAIARHGKVVQLKALGLQDIESQTPMTTDTIFRIYSMTKPITSVAAMILYDQGKLKLDTPIEQILPGWSGLKVVTDPQSEDIQTEPVTRSITVHDLFCHTAGLTYGFFGNTNIDKLYRKTFNAPPPDAVLADMSKAMGELPLLYHPGSKWHYSYATDILGHVIEKVSGQPLDIFLKEKIFEPLDMIDTGFYVPKKDIKRFATTYGPNKEKTGLAVVDVPKTSPFAKKTSFFSGGGGLVSTASDYMRFCLMLLNHGEYQGHRILKPKTLQMMTENHLSPALMPIAFGKDKRHGVGFGLGFSVRVKQTDWEIASRIGEYGWGGAASTHFWISPNDGIVVVVLSQYMPYNDLAERALKPIIYDSIKE